MKIASASMLSSPWVLELEKQLLRRKHILLYGNIRDQFLYRGEYLDVNDLLNRYLLSKLFDLIVRFDLVDGWSFVQDDDAVKPLPDAAPLPSDKRARFDEIKHRAMVSRHPELGGVRSSSVGLSPSEVNPLIAPPQGIPGRGEASQPRLHVTPEEAFSHLRIVLAQNQTSVTAIVDLADMLTSDPNHYAGEERTALMFLKKCTLEASLIPSGPLAGRRNSLIILADELKRVPEWFYRDNPFVSIVQANRPDKDERRQFALHFIRPCDQQHQGFFGGNLISDQRSPDKVSELEELSEEFADLTEGFQTIDLDALRGTSFTARIPVRAKQVRRLVDFFKFGLKDDPWEKLNPERVRQARDELSKSVIGQPRAVDAVVAMLTSARVGLNLSGGSQGGAPKGVFFFVGPTGVGKTELAKAVTKLVFGDERAFARFDMSEYKEEHAAEKLAGAPPGFVGYEEGGQLTNRVLQNPHSILLFDEIEKAHEKVLDKFLQILEDGRLTDGKGQTAYFNQTAIIFTSNIGASNFTDAHSKSIIREGIMHVVQQKGTNHFTYAEVTKHFEEEVKWYFNSRIGRAELLNRLGDNIVVFDLLRPEFIEPIGLKFTSLLASASLEKFRVTLRFMPSWFDFLRGKMQHGDNMLMGGRRIKTLTISHLVNSLNEWIFSNVPDTNELAGQILEVGVSREGLIEVKNV